MTYDPNTQLVIARNLGVDKFAKVLPNGAHEPLGFPASMAAIDVAVQMAMANPDKQIGIMAETFGDETKAVYGEIVWLKKGFEKGR